MHVTPFNVFTSLMMISTAGVIWARFRKPAENNWPLVYYLGLVTYLKSFDGALAPLAVYIGSVTCLFLRFEFMGGFILKAVRAIDLVILAYFMGRGVALLMKW